MHRDLSDEEIAHFRQHGWLLARRLIDPALARQLAPEGLRILRESTYMPAGYASNAFKIHHDEALELTRAIALSPSAGRNVTRLLRGAHRVRMMGSNFISKYEGNAGTGYHQDFPGHPIDRSEMLTVWIALDDIGPDMGGLRFVDGSHRYGALGLSLQRPGDDTLSVHPWLLEELKLTDAPSLAPGDATFHHGLMVHGADINATDRPRLAYQTLYCDADALYTGETLISRYGKCNLEVYKPMDHPSMPVVPTA
jgi:ectoine hydroxylase-related dioxygenase (phytanoyl-CoA dioxygenase family)